MTIEIDQVNFELEQCSQGTESRCVLPNAGVGHHFEASFPPLQKLHLPAIAIDPARCLGRLRNRLGPTAPTPTHFGKIVSCRDSNIISSAVEGMGRIF